MLQIVDGREVYVVEFDAIPELPITWSTPDEEPYARALHNGIEHGMITEPGKYGIYLDQEAAPTKLYMIYKIIE